MDDKDKATYLFEIKLDDNFKLYKEPGRPSVLIKGKVSYTIKKNEVIKPNSVAISEFKSIQKLYDKPYGTSDKVKNQDFWEAVLITDLSLPLKSIRIF